MGRIFVIMMMDRKSREVEYRHHISMVLRSFFEFTPYDNFDEKLNKGTKKEIINNVKGKSENETSKEIKKKIKNFIYIINTIISSQRRELNP